MKSYTYEDIPDIYKLSDYCLENEIWKDIPDYENLYQASNLGRIRSINGKTTFTERHGVRTWTGRIMKFKTRSSYSVGLKVSLWKNGKHKDLAIHRLVAVTFLGCSNLTVNHIDGNRLNNNIKNLEWLSIGDNIREGFKAGLYPTKKIVLLINNKKIKFISLSQASKFLGKTDGYISNAIKKHVNIYDKDKNIVKYKLLEK